MTAQLSDPDFAAVRDYLARTAGLVFDENRRAGLAVVVADRLKASGRRGVADYLAGLGGDEGDVERLRLLDGVTVQETHFFRNTPQMEALRQRVLPDLMRRAARRDRPLTIWSAGCSTGEEAYTLAMLILELSASGATGPAGLPPRIVATDISTKAVLAARQATYRGRTLATMPPGARERWFEPRSAGGWAVREEARRLVDVHVHNLVGDPPPFAPGEVDLVVCRNVTIYFSRETTRSLIGRFHDVIAEGGYLLLGHSETLWQVSDAFTLVAMGDAFLYRRTADVRSQPSPPSKTPARVVRQVPRRRTPAPLAVDHLAVDHLAVDHLAVDHLAVARAAFAAGDYGKAARVAEAATESDPLNAEGYVVLGHARSTLGQDAQAVDPLRKAVYLDPAAGHAHFLLAGALSRMGQHGPAAVSYRAAAGALPKVSRPVLDSYLGGRSVQDLVDLCERLARGSVEAAGALAAGGAAL
jgi:chemotaxis protein methyltransferase CheR